MMKGTYIKDGTSLNFSMVSPWEVLVLGVKLKGDEGKYSYKSLVYDGLVEDMDIAWRLIFLRGH